MQQGATSQAVERLHLHWLCIRARLVGRGFNPSADKPNEIKRAGTAAQDFSRITRIAVNLLEQNKTSKLGMKGKRLKPGWDHDYLIVLLGGTV